MIRSEHGPPSNWSTSFDYHVSIQATRKAGTPFGSQWQEREIVARERRRIAREIHDGVAQDLAALSLKMRLCQRQLKHHPSGLSAELDEIRATLDTTLVELRRIICGLRPAALEEHGFIVALHMLAAEFNAQHPLYVHLAISGDESDLPHALELPLLRMAQEALHNIAQHAQATRASMTLSLTPNELTFLVEDNGCGFTTGGLLEKVRSGHIGLQQMQERVAAHRGTLTIQSEMGQGTRLVATFSAI